MEATNLASPQAAPSQAAPAQEVVETAPVVETPAVEKPKQTEDELTMSRRFAVLARQHKALEAKNQKIKEQWAEVEAYQNAKKQAQLDPIGLIEKLGIDYRKITDAVLSDRKPTPEMLIQNLREQVEKDRQERDAAAQRAKVQEADRVIDSHKAEISEFINSKPDEFELIRANDAAHMVLEIIENVWTKAGKILPYQEVAKEVEEWLEAETKKLLGLKKFQSYLKPKEEPVEPELKNSPQSSTPPRMVVQSPTTLTNKMASQAVPSPASKGYLSDEESKKRLAEWYRSQMR